MPRRKNSKPQTLEETVYRLYREQYKREYNRNRYKSTTWTIPLKKRNIYDYVNAKVETYGKSPNAEMVARQLDARKIVMDLTEGSRYLDKRQMGEIADFYGGSRDRWMKSHPNWEGDLEGDRLAAWKNALDAARETLTDRKDDKGIAMLNEWEAAHPMPTDSESFMEWFRDAPLVLKKKLVNEYMSTDMVGNVTLGYEGEEWLDL